MARTVRSEVTVALEGTLDTVSLPEVLRLLAAGKSGRLRLEGPRGAGSVLVRGGLVATAETPRTGSVHTAADLPEAVFELLRWDTGSFSFAASDGPAPDEEQSAGVAVDELLAEATARLERWREVEAVVPSLASSVEVVEQLDGPEAVVTAASWPVLVAAARSATVGDVGSHLALDEVACSGAVRDLVTSGLVRVGAAPAPTGGRSVDESMPGRSAGTPSSSSQDGDGDDGGVALLRRLTGAQWTWVDDGAGGRTLRREGGPEPVPSPAPDWAVDGAVAAVPVAPVVAPRGVRAPDDPPRPVAERRAAAAPGIDGGPDWADDETLDQAFAGWEPGPSPEAHPLERELVLPGPDHPEPPAMTEHRLLERLLGTLRA
jgi:hypothetical protein